MPVVRNADTERLALLGEELGESNQAVGKSLRHGLDSRWQRGPTNAEDLAREIGQVIALARMMVAAGDLDQDLIDLGEQSKYADVQPFLHFEQNRRLARRLAAEGLGLKP